MGWAGSSSVATPMFKKTGTPTGKSLAARAPAAMQSRSSSRIDPILWAARKSPSTPPAGDSWGRASAS